MPREMTHWLVLEAALQRLGGEYAALLEKSGEKRSALLLGAVLHDAPYYHRLGRSEFVKVGNYLHGHADRDTLDPVRKLISAATAHDRNLIEAIAIGMISHIATDVAFHPFIFYFTGDYYHPDKAQRTVARARHRLIEVFLDSWAQARFGNHFKTERISRFSSVFPVVGKYLSEAVQLEGTPHGEQLWRESFGDMGKLQSLFISTWAGALMRMNNYISRQKLAEWDALYSFGRHRVPSFFDAKHRYQNPVTGDWLEESCEQIFERAVKRTVDLVTALDQRGLEGIKGESLNYAVFGVAPEAGKYFAPTDDWTN